MDKVPNGSNVIAQFLGERERFTNQAPNSLTQGVVEPLSVTCQACFLTYCLIRLRGQNSLIRLPGVGVTNRALTIDIR